MCTFSCNRYDATLAGATDLPILKCLQISKYINLSCVPKFRKVAGIVLSPLAASLYVLAYISYK